MGKCNVLFLPDQTEIEVDAGTSILQAAGEAGVELDGPCGGKGTCGKCHVNVRDDNAINKRVLACRTQIEDCMIVEIPQLEFSLYRKNELSLDDVKINVNSGITKRAVKVSLPSLENQHPDAARLLNALDGEADGITLEALRELPKTLRKRKGYVTAVILENQVLAVEPEDTSKSLYGVALDIGTTTLVAALVNLLNGDTIAIASAGNPQSTFGADVIARIEHTVQNQGGLEQLHRRVVHTVNRLIDKLAKDFKISPLEIYQMTVVGNTTMSHLFLKVDPEYLASSPFIPSVSTPVQVTAKELGITISPHAPVYVAPSIAGYIGGDTVGVIVSTEIYKREGTFLAIDIGTNGEIVLAHNGQMISCSTAAGPAFEGAQIKFGMRAARGAIEKVKIENDVKLQVIGNLPAKGICGSGLIDAVAEMKRVGIIEPNGRLISRSDAVNLSQALQGRLGADDKGAYFILAFPGESLGEAVVITQKDIRELQLAKGAIRAGIQVLLEQSSLSCQDIDEVLLAGAFGSYVDKFSALQIGLIPPVPPHKINSVGNAAGTGARKILVSKDVRRKAEMIADKVIHLELSCRTDFQKRFVDFLGF